MGYPLDEAAQNATLDSMLGDNAGGVMPSSFEVALFTGDPASGGTELLSSGGYARATVANDSASFPDASGGQKVSAAISFSPPSGAWVGAVTDEVTHWLLVDAADSTTQYFSRPFADPFTIVGTEPSVAVQLVVAWNVEAI